VFFKLFSEAEVWNLGSNFDCSRNHDSIPRSEGPKFETAGQEQVGVLGERAESPLLTSYGPGGAL